MGLFNNDTMHLEAHELIHLTVSSLNSLSSET